MAGGSAGFAITEDRGASWFSIRPAAPTDSRFLTDMLIEAANWDGSRPRARVALLDDPGVERYVVGWPRPGDFGSVAVDARGTPIGACWARLFPENAPGNGFVSTGVPELILGVNPLWRARGVGRSLLQAIARQASSSGHLRLSLNVGHGNYAQRLYVSEGYVTVSSSSTSDTMVRVLR
jgi:GNAT superfamily N-acetyltransferase